MTLKDRLKDLVRRNVYLIARHSNAAHQDRRNCDTVLSAAMSQAGALSGIGYPVAYVDFLRKCLDATDHRVTKIKRISQPQTTAASKRFDTLVDLLGTHLPAIEFSIAKDIAVIADQIRGRCEPLEADFWAGDVGLHFSIASSLGEKGRILFNVVRIMRSERCLEIGTAYGLSALFILSALKRSSGSGRLTTIEAFEPQFSMASSMLKQQYGDAVCCTFGLSNHVLPQIADSPGGIDFMFHDGGHSREDYVRDFGNVIKILTPGAVVLFDDIRWHDPNWSHGPSDTYQGWQEVIAHPRVEQAVEIDGLLGLVLLR